jgi:hypothetical protein
VTASTDAVRTDDGNSKPAMRRKLPWLPTAAVLLLIYQQVPPPFGVTAIKPWLHYAIWAVGSLLLAQCVRDGARAARGAARKVRAKLREFTDGFEFRYSPGRQQDRELDDRDVGNDDPA